MWVDQEKVLAAKRAFQRGEPFDPSVVRPVILESWKRSRAFGVRMDTRLPRILTGEELAERCRQRREFCDVALPFVESLREFATGAGFVMTVCDEEVYVLQVTGDEDLQQVIRAGGMVEGCNRNERRIGTNGVGTPVETGQPVQVFSEEHYFGPSRKWGCTGAPIFRPDGSVAGGICLISPYEKVGAQTLALAVSVAENIRRQMKMRETFETLDHLRRNLSIIIETWPSGILLLNQDLTVVQANAGAARLLMLPREALEGAAFFELIGRRALRESEVRRGVTDRLVTIERGTQTMSLSFSIQRADAGSCVVMFETAETLHRKVSRIVGSDARFRFDDIIGGSPALRDAVELARVAAGNNSNVLLSGESGTGKELFAQAIHNASARRREPVVALNCGALPKSLIESELFGYEGGSFTGANRDGRAGKFELANGGTIFLDEIGDMPFDVQVSLLRVLQTREVSRIGSSKTVKVDVRVISATNQNLIKAIERNEFRSDLYYRLNVFDIRIPPLRDRQGDIVSLADYFFRKYASDLPHCRMTGLSPEAYALLCRYQWPGNVRELENAVERAIYLAKSDQIGPECFPEHIRAAALGETAEEMGKEPMQPEAGSGAAGRSGCSLREIELRQIRRALSLSGGNVSRAGELLGLSRRTVYRKMERYGLDISNFRTEG